MMKTDRLTVNYNGRPVGTLSLTPDNKLCAFEYAKEWLLDGFSIGVRHRAAPQKRILWTD